MICPNCKCEYVDGITECPDCKIPLKISLEEEPEFMQAIDSPLEEELEEAVEENYIPMTGEVPYEDEIKEMVERRRLIDEMPVYKSVADSVANNRSGAAALIACGMIGGAALILNAFGLIHLPVSGFSLVLVYVVMGCLFFAFFVSGWLSLYKVIKLTPQMDKERENIDKVLEFIKANKDKYKAETDGLESEEAYLKKCDLAVKDAENEFPDLEPGFAYYVVDRMAGDILDED